MLEERDRVKGQRHADFLIIRGERPLETDETRDSGIGAPTALGYSSGGPAGVLLKAVN